MRGSWEDQKLGDILKENRQRIKYTLRQVEETIGISNSYLSQLENYKIKRPSANVLYKLANLYKIELTVLLEAAGIIEHREVKTIPFEHMKFPGPNNFEIDEKEQEQLIEYLQFLRHKKNKTTNP